MCLMRLDAGVEVGKLRTSRAVPVLEVEGGGVGVALPEDCVSLS
jgi:hypothetical protein